MGSYKLAFVIERYFEFGGLQRNMLRFALACAKQGHDVTVFTGRWEGPLEPPVKVEIVDFAAWTNHGMIKKIEAFVGTLKTQDTFDCIIGFHRIGGLDVYYSGDVCLKAKLQQQRRWRLRFLPRYQSYLKQEEAVFGRASDTDLMLISPVEAEKFQQIYATPANRIHMLPPGIDRDRLASNPLPDEKRRQFRNEFGAGDNDLIILTVGSSFRTKGIDRAIGAIAALPEELKNRCRYLVVGQGQIGKFHAIANRAGLGDRVYFTGGRQDIANFYAAADILLHPARTENTGNTLLEAMVCGLPVIATDACGYAPYIRQAGAGTVCPEPFAPQQLNRALYEMLAIEPQRLQYGKNGQQYCRTADLYSRTEKGVEVILDRAERNRGQR